MVTLGLWSLDLYQNIVMSIHSKVLASAYKSVIK